MHEIRILVPTGLCASGFLESSFEKPPAREPHPIGFDAGSTDPGASLGSGGPTSPRDARKRTLRLILNRARRSGVPRLIGCAGTAGGEVRLGWFSVFAREIAADESLAFRLAVVQTQQDKNCLTPLLRGGRVRALKAHASGGGRAV